MVCAVGFWCCTRACLHIQCSHHQNSLMCRSSVVLLTGYPEIDVNTDEDTSGEQNLQKTQESLFGVSLCKKLHANRRGTAEDIASAGCVLADVLTFHWCILLINPAWVWASGHVVTVTFPPLGRTLESGIKALMRTRTQPHQTPTLHLLCTGIRRTSISVQHKLLWSHQILSGPGCGQQLWCSIADGCSMWSRRWSG